jgi:hypothetical protein
VGGHSLAELGLAGVPLLDPLSYPGPPVPWPALLRGDRLLPLAPAAGPVGRWRTGESGRELDAVLRAAEAPPIAERVAVVATGSNSAPGQMRHKLLAAGCRVVLPMVPVVVTGVRVGVSAHISAPGYVGAAPFTAPGRRPLTVAWLDADQLAAVDATEPNYRRVPLPPDRFPVALPDGRVLPEAWLYVGRHGVLAPGGGAPRPCGDQRALLSTLLAGSARLRELLGPAPRDWVIRAAADPLVRAEGRREFAALGWVVRERGPLAADRPRKEPYGGR